MCARICFIKLLIGLLTGLFAGAAIGAEDHSVWGKVTRPSASQRAQAIGFYSSGCLSGGATLALVGTGFQVMRPHRNRFYGHPDLIALLHRLGKQTAARGIRIFIGDLSQPRGGPMSFGHRSHQIGLDVDIWFRHIPATEQVSYNESIQMSMRPVADPKRGTLTSAWRPIYRDLLRWVAETPEVDRVFVNPVIKQALCREPANHRWLNKIRAWWGHDSHFHVRLACPDDNPRCRAQKPPPPGSGCGPDLDRWVEEQKSPKPRKWSPPKPFVLPQSCYAVLQARP